MGSNKDVVIGLEVHVQLKTRSKLFCGCSTDFGAAPNSNTCPVCMGFPGSLPVLNKRAVEFGMMAAMTLNCEINERMKFDRKNYYYPDLPKAYQISQYDMPLAGEGELPVKINNSEHNVGVERVHLEEDAGKLIHSSVGNESYVDYNRGGTPLIEIVSKPDIEAPEVAEAYLKILKQRLEYLEVSDCNMEEGSLRCDANLSIRNPDGSLGVKTEVKNMNSFKGVRKALEYEARRQQRRLDKGQQIVQGTRQWDEEAGKTRAMRSKEEAHDYRYFPEPDLVPVVIAEEWKSEIEEDIPEMPTRRRRRFVEQYNLSNEDAETLTSTRPMADYYEKALETGCDSEILANLMISDLRRELNDRSWTVQEVEIAPSEFAELAELLEKDEISTNVASELLEELVGSGGSPVQVVEERDLKQISDEDALGGIVEEVIEENPGAVEDIRGGTEQAIGYLVGQVMQKTQGQANPGRAKEMLREKILQ